MTAVLTDFVERLLRTETLVAIAAIVLVATGRVASIDEALAVAGPATALILGRSWVKGTGVK